MGGIGATARAQIQARDTAQNDFDRAVLRREKRIGDAVLALCAVQQRKQPVLEQVEERDRGRVLVALPVLQPFLVHVG